jgi:hypothetical protein
MRKVTAVLVKWKRPKELEIIYQLLSECVFIDEILVCDNTSSMNYGPYGRFVMAARAKNDVIFSQDDDCVVRNPGSLINLFNGQRIVCGMKPDHMRAYEQKKWHDSGGMLIGWEALLGWGSVWKREWIGNFLPYIERYSVDDCLMNCGDRMFSVLTRVKPLMVEADIVEFHSAYDPEIAMYYRDDLPKFEWQAKNRLAELRSAGRL